MSCYVKDLLCKLEVKFLRHHILRISKDEWVKRVFKIRKYYTGMRSVKGWESGSTVIFLKKVGKFDSIIGYGVIKRIKTFRDMNENEKSECKEHGWKIILEFSKVKKLKVPKPVKETLVSEWNAKGRYLHGRCLTDEEVSSILADIS